MESRNQWFTEDGFARQEELAFAQCDCAQRARPATLVKLCAAMGGHHCDAKGLTYDVLQTQGRAFLLSRVAFHIHQMPQNRQTVTIRTWENGTKGPYFLRVFEWYDEVGNLLVSAKSDWVMVHPESHKVCRPDAAVLGFRSDNHKLVDCPDCQKLPAPKVELPLLDTHRVRWSELDGNGHLHSGNYPDILWDALPSDWQNRTLDTFLLNFNKEARLGEEILLHGTALDADTFFVQGDACFTARCLFQPVSPGDAQ